MLELQIKDLPKSPNQIGRSHWHVQAAHKREWTDKIGWLAKAKYKGNLKEFAHVHFAICTGDRRRHDPDNLAFAVTKPTLDGLKGIVIVDDSIDDVELSYEFSRDGERGFTVYVE